MHVRFRVNLGSRDAERHGLDFRLCEQGMMCNVPEKAGQWLVGRGIAHEVPAEIRAVPAMPEIGKTDEPVTMSEPAASASAKRSTKSKKDE